MEQSRTMRRSLHLWDAALESVPGVFYVLDADGHYVLWNRQFERVSGYSSEEIHQLTPATFFSPEDWPRVQEAIARVFSAGSAEIFAELRGRNGLTAPYHYTGRRFHHAGQDYLVGVGLDISELQRARTELEHSEALFRALTESARGMTTVVSPDCIVLYQSPAIFEILGYSPQAVMGKTYFDFLHPEDEVEARRRLRFRLSGQGETLPDVDLRFRHANGEWRCLSTRASSYNAVLRGIVVNSYDVTEQRQAERHVRYLALHDALTGLANRQLLQDRVVQALRKARRERRRGALLFIDLDRFKNVNDSLGHAVGDALLKSVAERFTTALRESDTVARHGGDEFVILLENVSDADGVRKVSQSLHSALSQPFLIEGHEIYATASIGAAMYSHETDDAATIIRRADTAMYRSKTYGRNRTTFYEPAMTTRLEEDIALEAELRRALDKRELELFYQPIVSASTLKLCGFEALLRWRHPTRGVLAPAAFLRMAEEAGLMHRIGDFVVHEACAQLSAWKRGPSPVRVAVNVSATELTDGDLLASVRDALEESQIPSNMLEVELTESAAMEGGGAAIATLTALSEMGIAVALDDFGTGYSSLSHLKRFKISRLKIDQSFVRDMVRSADDVAIVEAVLALAKSIGVDVVAEGVETPEELEMLRSRGCSEVQGYLFSRPLDRAQATDFAMNAG